MWLPLLSAIAVAADPCATRTSVPEISAALADALSAWEQVDLDAFDVAVGHARERVPCLAEEVPRSVVAQLHRLEGLAAFAADRPDRSTIAFGAARRLEPDYRFPLSVVPEGHPVLGDYTAVDPAATRLVAAKPPADGRIRFDGAESRDRPGELPTLFQHVLADGGVSTSAYLWPEDPLPDYPIAPPTVAMEPPAPAPVPQPEPLPRTSPRKPLLIAALASVGTSAALYGTGIAVHSRFMSDNVDEDALAGLRTLNNGLVVAAGVTFGAGAGCGVAALAAGR